MANTVALENHCLPPKRAMYSDTQYTDTGEVLVLGDSIVRFVKLPGAVTYCLSGGKVADFIELSPTLLDLHPAVHTVILHCGVNDVTSSSFSFF